MHVSVRLFAGLRERAGADEIDVELPDGALVADALEWVRALTGGTRVVMAVNHEYAGADTPLEAGDELALIPPVSGGSVGALHVRVTDEPLSADALRERVRDPRAGAVVVFEGVTREVAESRAMLTRELGQAITTIAYPHGECDRGIEHLVGGCGYLFGLSTRPALSTQGDSLLALPRIEITRQDRLPDFVRKLSGTARAVAAEAPS